jgi:carbon-monoxide dehydrogenase large subunit
VAKHGNADATMLAIAGATHCVTLDLTNQRVVPAPIEPRATLASYDEANDRITLRLSCQTPTGVRDELAPEVLGLDKEMIRVVVGDVGGGFGMKTALYCEDVVAAWAREADEAPG